MQQVVGILSLKHASHRQEEVCTQDPGFSEGGGGGGGVLTVRPQQGGFF